MSVRDDAGLGREDATIEYVTVTIGDQLFGLPINRVQDVFMPELITRVPLSSRQIAGVLNLRGRIVTVINMRERLQLPPKRDAAGLMAVGIESKGESYGLLIDSVGEVLRLPADGIERNPANLDKRWAQVCGGVQQLDGQLMVILDVDKILDMGIDSVAA